MAVKRIFISYRRDDTGSPAGRLFDRLRQVFTHVFFDVETTRGGEDFEKRIASEIRHSDVVLVFIGKSWLAVSRDGDKPRLWEPNDHVRAELRAALLREVLVLPILVDGARMPPPELLPEDISTIAKRNAMPLRHESFEDDSQNIVRTILGRADDAPPWMNHGDAVRRMLFAPIGAAIALVVAVAGAFVHDEIFDRPLSASIGASTTTLLLIVCIVVGAWAGFACAPRQGGRKLEP
jgi:hypothetical protein